MRILVAKQPLWSIFLNFCHSKNTQFLSYRFLFYFVQILIMCKNYVHYLAYDLISIFCIHIYFENANIVLYKMLCECVISVDLS